MESLCIMDLCILVVRVSKAEELFEIWNNCRGNKWEEKLKEVGEVSQEDVNGFLRLVGEGDKKVHPFSLGVFVSRVLNICYVGDVIELDVGVVEGKIDVGTKLNKNMLIYVKGFVEGNIGDGMKNGIIIVDGDVKGRAGYYMEGGIIVVNGNVDDVGWGMMGGYVDINGVAHEDVGYSMDGGIISIKGTVLKEVGPFMHNGTIIVKGSIRGSVGNEMDGGLIIVNGYIHSSSLPLGYQSLGGTIVVNYSYLESSLLRGIGEAIVLYDDMAFVGQRLLDKSRSLLSEGLK